MPFPIKKIIASLILMSFLMIALFSFAVMAHGPDGQMLGNCLFPAIGKSFCPQDALAAVIHHVSAYQSFLSAPMLSSATILFILLPLFACAVIMLYLSPPLFKPSAFTSRIQNNPALFIPDRKIRSWLSLFENSPSLI